MMFFVYGWFLCDGNAIEAAVSVVKDAGRMLYSWYRLITNADEILAPDDGDDDKS